MSTIKLTNEKRAYQAEFIGAIESEWQRGAKVVLGVLPTAGGKCLGKGTPVLMFNGAIKPVEQIKPGDLLMGPDSKSRTVISICSGSEPLYQVVPTKGDPYVVNESHILSLRITGGNCRVSAPSREIYSPGDVVNIGVTDYLRASKTFRHVAKGWRTGVNFPKKRQKHFITPYILGVWLGDGTSSLSAISNVDPEVQVEWACFAEKIGCRLVVQENAHRINTYYIRCPVDAPVGRGYKSNPVLNELRRLNVLNNKHIPRSYLTASRADRLELLAGILDTDGYLHHGRFDIIVKQPQFGTDILFLARSLGFAAYGSLCKKTCTNTGVTGDYFRISISGDTSIIPVRVSRRIPETRISKKNVLNAGIDIKPLGVGDYFGFELSGPDHLFLLGDFTVTHNTFCFTDIISRETGFSCAVAHRKELVGQMSLALNKRSIAHFIMAPENTIRWIVGQHVVQHGFSCYQPNSRCAVASVNTIMSRSGRFDAFCKRVNLWVMDEGHHVTKTNLWGKAIAKFPEVARGLLVTATPERTDGQGLGRHHDGVVDAMVLGPTPRELIRQGFLSEYRIFCGEVGFDRSQIPIAANGEFSQSKLIAATRGNNRIIGGIVEHYLKHAAGKLGITFVPSVDIGADVAAAYRAAGVPAEVVSAKTPDRVRNEITDRLKRHELLNLVNVDIFGEGFDLPAIEVVSDASATESYGRFVQRFGRMMRVIPVQPGKVGIYIDHVGNIRTGATGRHPLPDAPKTWTLDRRERKSAVRDTGIPMRICTNPPCGGSIYEAYHKRCPYCGAERVIMDRSRPEFVDGNLFELDPSVLAFMRGEIDRIDAPDSTVLDQWGGVKSPASLGAMKQHRLRSEAQTVLRGAIALWAGLQRHYGRDDSESYKRFFWRFGYDVMTAQTLGRPDAEALTMEINKELGLI